MPTCERCGTVFRFTAQEEAGDPRPPYTCPGCRTLAAREADRPKNVSTLDIIEAVMGLHGFRSPPRPHSRSGEVVLEVVFADPGSNGFYYRERKPDSVAAFLRLDLVMGLVQRARAEGAVERTTLDHWRQEAGKLHSRVATLEEKIRLYRESLEKMSDTDPDEVTAWFHDRIEELLKI